jgi:hypothetical protein
MNGPRSRYFSIIILFVLAAAIAWSFAGGGASGFAQSAAMVIAITMMDAGAARAIGGWDERDRWRFDCPAWLFVHA